MSDKKKNINEGKDISLDDGNITILNGVSVAEKAEEKVPEVATAEPAIEPAETQTVVPEINQAQTEQPEIPDTEFAAPVDPFMGEIPTPIASVESSAPFTQGDIPTYPQMDSTNPIYKNQVMEDELAGNQTLFTQDAKVAGVNDFNKSFDEVSYEKVASTIVNPTDAQEAKDAYMAAAEKLYDKGPGFQIKILMEVAAKQNAKLLEIAQKGFMNAKDYEEIKALDNVYKGLKQKEVPEYSDNQNNMSFGGMNY